MAGQTKKTPLVSSSMAYEVLARKWRPKNFSELIGQDSVRQTLINGLKQNRIYPVLLFTGPRGTGKTSSARILAKNLRCQNQTNFIPCDQCEDCLFIQDSRHLDVIEIDGASNNGVEAVRELRDTVAYMPSTGSRKIYIIDEVHMLSNSAFNALLKTFEEPPKHILFIMATTEIRKIPPTVLSRAQRLDFHALSPSNIKKQLEMICQQENLAVSEDLLWIIAKQARGSLRDGQSLLDQIVTFCGKDFNKKEALKLLGLSDPEMLFQCLQALIYKKERLMIELIENLRAKGVSSRLFLQGLIETLSHLLFLKKNPSNQPKLVQAGEREIEQMKKEIKGISYEDLHFLFDMLLKGERDMSFCHDSQLALEVLLLRLCGAPRLETIVPLNALSLEEEPREDKLLKSPSSLKKQKPAFQKEQKPANNSLAPSMATIESQAAPSPKAELKSEKTIQKNKTEYENFEQRFDFLKFLKEKDQNLSALAEHLNIKQKSLKLFCFAMPEKFSYLKNKITDPFIHKLLEDYLTEFLNVKEKVKIEFLNNKKEASLKEEKKAIEKDQLLTQVQKDPFVNELKDIFGGEIKSVIKKSQ